MSSQAEISDIIKKDGVLVVENVLDKQLVADLVVSLEKAIAKEAEYHKTESYKDYGMVLLCALYDRIFVDLCGHEGLMKPFEAVLGEGCTIYAYTSSSMPPKGANYSNRIHVDCPRIIPGYVTNMGATIALNDFTVDNGATWYLPGSQELAEEPSSEYFFANAKRFVAPAGSVLYFNARVWHCGGENQTSSWRHGLTINMARPWMKQRIDIPAALTGRDLSDASEKSLSKTRFLCTGHPEIMMSTMWNPQDASLSKGTSR